jgi:hypothetical protein
MRLSVAIDRTARQFQQAITNSAARFKILQTASNTVLQFAKGFKRGEGAQVVTPQRLADAIRKCDLQDSLAALAEPNLLQGCEAAGLRRRTKPSWTQTNWTIGAVKFGPICPSSKNSGKVLNHWQS